ncbi:MAG: hypothetical protein GY711_20710 [bacterium]|nr:hypothetical protein [bacterium]
MSSSRRRKPWDFDLFGPGTDLSISLFAIMAVGFIWMSGLRKVAAGELDLTEIQLDNLKSDSAQREEEVRALKPLLERYEAAYSTPELAESSTERLRSAEKAEREATRERDTARADHERAKESLERVERSLRLRKDQARSLKDTEAKLRAAQAALATATDELAAARRRQGAAVSAAVSATRREEERKYKELQDRILKPFPNARLVVSIEGDVPADADLDLHLQLPPSKNEIVNYMSPRVFHGAARKEVGVLVLSEDFQRVSGTSEEVFYGLDAVTGPPYMLACMVRQYGPAASISIKVKWTVQLFDARGQELDQATGTRFVRATGRVHMNPGSAPVYTGLNFLAAIEVRGNNLVAGPMPTQFRGWSTGKIEAGATEQERFRDKSSRRK